MGNPGTCQQCRGVYRLDPEMDTIVRHENGLGQRCRGSYLPSQEFIDSIVGAPRVTIFEGTIDVRTGTVR